MTITDRDKSGRILPGGKKLTSAEAREISKIRGDKKESTNALLQEAGYDDPDKAPEHLRVMAQLALKSTSAMAAWRKVTQLETVEKGGSEIKVCPFQTDCSIYEYRDGNYPEDVIAQAAARLEADNYTDD